jgi:mono/diheme cytochrome c family protein
MDDADRSWWPWVAGSGLAGIVLLVLNWALHRADPPSRQEPYHEASSEVELRSLARDPAHMARGRQLYSRNCTLCHGTVAEGGSGPNLRDEFWLHGADLTAICENIANGNPLKGMAAWKPVLKPADLHALAVFLASLQGSEDGSGKKPEGARQPMTWRGESGAP